MEEQNKYFTPDIEDLHINYECEQKLESEWISFVIDHKSFLYTSLRDLETSEESVIRTKYLDTDDIISLGWIKTDLEGYFVKENERSLYRLEYIGTWLDINQILKQRYPQFDINYPGEFHEASDRGLFSGECKSINELRIIHKLLKIN